MHRRRSPPVNGGKEMSELTFPEEGELVVCTVSGVKQNGAYTKLDNYGDLEGFIFIGEIASGWVKNIRGFVREGQRLVCKVMRTRKDGRSVELSLKSVSEERRRDTMQAWKNEQRANQLLKVLGEKSGWDEEGVRETSTELIEAFGTLYSAFEESAINEGAMTEAGFEGDWIKDFIEIAIENIIPPFIHIKGTFTIECPTPTGIEVIKEALLAAESFSDEEKEISVTCHYDGAPQYRIELKAPDYKSGENTWDALCEKTLAVVEDAGGNASAIRE